MLFSDGIGKSAIQRKSVGRCKSESRDAETNC